MATTLNPSEISELIKSRIEQFKLSAETRNEGTLTSVSDGIVRIHGLNDVMAGEMIELPGDTYALALNLERDSVGAVVLGKYEHLSEGNTAKTTGRILEAPVGVAAGADRLQVGRLDDPDRPWPARTGDWRPPDRQVCARGRHHHQPEG